MRLFVVVSLFALNAGAAIIFDPPNPTSITPVVAHVAVQGSYCSPTKTTVERHGSIISITFTFPPCARPALPGTFDVPVGLGAIPAGVYDVVAGPDNILILLAEGKLAVQDAAPPFDVVPNVLPVTVNIGAPPSVMSLELRARGADLFQCSNVTPPPDLPPGACESITVKVGGEPLLVTSKSQSRVVVQFVPPPQAGVVDVTIDRSLSGPLTATAALDFYSPSSIEPAFFEPVVFPALVTGAGAFGSRWTTDVAMRNENDSELPDPTFFFRPMPPHSRTIVNGANNPAGFLYFVARQSAPKVFFDILARDLSQQSLALGTEIPVVRERDLYDRAFVIVNIPTDPKYRSTLRVMRTDGGSTAHVRLFNTLPGGVVAEADLQLTQISATYSSATVDLLQRFPQLAGYPVPIDVEVNAGTTAHVAWGFVSVTNNETQHVTVISPH